ncbi:unnamed protein product [Lathyrus sativus]|nr:unnamed protein product [Lathyrus sativus]
MYVERKKGIDDEKSLVEKRLKEFEFAMESILQHLEESNNVESGEDFVHVLRFDGNFDWKKIHSLILRELRRLEEGLPIYPIGRKFFSKYIINK